MKKFICMSFVLLFTTQLHAVTYSWVDDTGTYNYTEDYSRVPKKFLKTVKRIEDVRQDAKPVVPPDPATKSGQAEKKEVKSAEVPGGENGLYGGKSLDAWRKEMEAREAELGRVEQHIKEMRKQIYETPGIGKAQFDQLNKDYDDSRAEYDQKYKSFKELIDAARKAGINVEIK